MGRPVDPPPRGQTCDDLPQVVPEFVPRGRSPLRHPHHVHDHPTAGHEFVGLLDFPRRDLRRVQRLTQGVDGKRWRMQQEILHRDSEVSEGTRESIGGVTPHRNRSGRRLI